MKKSARDDAWEKLFQKYDISEEVSKNGIFKITADQIKEFKEPRLMTYFDEYQSLPQVFKDKNLSLISVSRNEYLIGKFDLYAAIEYDEKTAPISIERIDLESLDPENLYNESSAILFAFNSLLLKSALETDDLSFTLNGRMSSQNFSFNVNLKDMREGKKGVEIIVVSNSQIEIDAGFESEDRIFIVEAKNRYVEQINLRQLYYPYKLWSKKVSKEVVPVFLVYTDSTFYIFVCKFEDPDSINSLKVLNASKYVIADERITMDDVNEVFSNVNPKLCTNVTFPQADKFERILDLMQLLFENTTMTTEEITQFFQFDVRQTSYYVTAASFLGIVERRARGVVSLTDLGKEIMRMPYRQKHKKIFSLIFEDVVFHDAYKYVKLNSDMPSKDFVANLIHRYYPPRKKEDSGTPNRRAGTVTSWLKWVLDQTE